MSAPLALSTAVAYPEGASGDARVLLELLIGERGQVREVAVLSGEEPFAAAAREAAADFRFLPARRGGLPIAARIRFVVHYTQPRPAPPVLRPLRKPPAPAPRAEVAPPASVEVTVEGEVAMGAHSLGGAEARALPGALGDPFRAVEVLPGVAPLVTGLPVSFVRGAPPGNVGFFLDGIRVPHLFHAFLGPAVIHPEIIERVDLYSGVYPARLGRYAGGIVSADLKAPPDSFRGEVSLRLVDAGAFLQVPFADGKGFFQLAGRYSYTALLLSLLSDFRLEYWDYQARIGYALTPQDRVSVLAFGAFDLAAPDEPQPDADSSIESGQSGVQFHRVDLRYDRRLGKSGNLRAALTLGRDETRGPQGSVQDGVSALRVELERELARGVVLDLGLSAQRDDYRLRLEGTSASFLDVVTLFPGRRDTAAGGYAELSFDVGSRLTLAPGVRVDRYESAEQAAWGVSPRLRTRARINDRVTIEQGIGVAHQPPNYVPAIPGVAVAGLPGGLQRSVQTTGGVALRLGERSRVSATAYYSATLGLSDPFGLSQDLDLDADEAEVRSLGRSVGLELMYQRPLSEGIGVLASYTLSRATRAFDRIDTRAGYDRPHILNLALTKTFGAGWAVGARGLFYSGVPGSRQAPTGQRVFDQPRSSPFARVDLRLEKTLRLGPSQSLSVVAEMLNASLSREVLRRPCNGECRDVSVGPLFLPSVGVVGRF